jgi:hypothetical protein
MNNEELTKLFEGVYATRMAKALLVEAEAKGRREALMGMPVEALIYAALLLRLDTGNIESVVNSKTVSEYEREISRLVESARAAQQEKTK